MAKPRLPTSFALMNREYRVRRATEAELKEAEDGLYGFCDYEEAEIVLFPHKNRDHAEHTYFHELAHALLMAIGRPDLAENEALVDSLAAALHQYEKTMDGRFNMQRKRKTQNGQSMQKDRNRGTRSRVR